MYRVHQDEEAREGLLLDVDEIARRGAKRMLAQALEAEVEAYLEVAKGERDEQGRALVARNGRAQNREVVCGAGTSEVRGPRVNDRRVDEKIGERMRFKSVILPPYMRRSSKVSEVLPLLYLHGLSAGDFVPALEEFFGSKPGLSPARSPGSPSGGEKSANGSCGAIFPGGTTSSTRGWTASAPA